MKIAIAYDWLNVKIGGGEETLFQIAKLYPDADIYCLIYNNRKFDSYLGHRNIFTSRLNKFPDFMKTRPNLLLPFIQKSVDKLAFDGYDVVISVSSAWVKNITVPQSTCHISYCYSPARMIWDSWPMYLDSQKIGALKVGRISRFFITRIASQLRVWDYYQSKGVYEFIAISKYISSRINKYYHRDSKLIYPPVKLQKYVKATNRDHYLCVSSLSRYKNIDIVIKTFCKNGLKLVIAGDGPDKDRLMALAKSANNISFVGRVDDSTKQTLLQTAIAFVFPSIEDFGIAPVEAISAGTPVIALKGGGLLETIVENRTGVFFCEPTSDSLQIAIDSFQHMHFDHSKITKYSNQFSSDEFDIKFPKTVEAIYNKWQDEQK